MMDMFAGLVVVFILVRLAEIIAMAFRYGDVEFIIIMFFILCFAVSGMYLIIINGC